MLGNRRRHHRDPRLLEKQMRPEVLERCLQFIDVAIHQIIYQENIYDSAVFAPHQMYQSLVYQCMDTEISAYITLCVASLRDLLAEQLSDMIAINIVRRSQLPIVLRRYLIELHTLHDPCLRAIYDNSKEMINEIDQAFKKCLEAIKQIKPLPNEKQCHSKGWTFQLRSCPGEQNSKGTTVGQVLRKAPIYKEFILVNQQTQLLSAGKQSVISSIKSLQSERVKLQFMCEEDKYEQNKFDQWKQFLEDNPPNNQEEEEETDCEDDEQTLFQASVRLSDDEQSTRDGFEGMKRRKKKTRRRLDSDSLIQRLQLMRENEDSLQYSSSDDGRPQSPYVQQNQCEDEDEEDDF